MAQGAAPVIPGLSQTSGLSPDAVSPMQMVAMMLGDKPGGQDSTTEKMAMIVQLLREVSKEDPRLSMLTSDALRLLIEGPSGQEGGGPVAPGPGGGPGSMMSPSSVVPIGGPGGPAY